MEKILIFKNNNSCNYWFKYVINYLKINGFIFKGLLYAKQIWINENILIFKPEYEVDEKFKSGRHYSQYYYDMDEKFEKDFIGNLVEVIYGKEGNVNI